MKQEKKWKKERRQKEVKEDKDTLRRRQTYKEEMRKRQGATKSRTTAHSHSGIASICAFTLCMSLCLGHRHALCNCLELLKLQEPSKCCKRLHLSPCGYWLLNTWNVADLNSNVCKDKCTPDSEDFVQKECEIFWIFLG